MIPQCSPHDGYIACQDEIDSAIRRVLDSGWYILGKEVEAFEAEFAEYCNTSWCISCANGTDALELAIRSLGIGRGDQIVTVANTAVATVSAIQRAEATPLFVDVSPQTYTMSPEALDQLLIDNTGNIKAVIAVHLFGQPVDIKSIKSIADKHDIFLIEDCAQAHGAMIDGKKIGSFGDVAAFSFYPTKNLGALGDGGAVVSNDAKLIERMRIIRQYGWEERYISKCQGINSRLDELHAAVLRVKLEYLDKDNARRQEIAGIYNSELNGLSNITLPATVNGNSHVYHQYVIQAEKRNQLKEYLRANEIGTAIHYPALIHKQPAYHSYSNIKLPISERLNERILSLPMFPGLTDEDIFKTTDFIKKFYL